MPACRAPVSSTPHCLPAFLPACRYAVSKTALLGLTKALAEELGPDGIRVNCIAPGVVPTKVRRCRVQRQHTSTCPAVLTSPAVSLRPAQPRCGSPDVACRAYHRQPVCGLPLQRFSNQQSCAAAAGRHDGPAARKAAGIERQPAALHASPGLRFLPARATILQFASALVASPKLEELNKSRTLLGRLGTPGDMAAAAAFLVSDDASYVTGETLVVAGGMQSRL